VEVPRPGRKRVVIVGGGFAGIAAASYAREAMSKDKICPAQ